jgi:hypothetical protein
MFLLYSIVCNLKKLVPVDREKISFISDICILPLTMCGSHMIVSSHTI